METIGRALNPNPKFRVGGFGFRVSGFFVSDFGTSPGLIALCGSCPRLPGLGGYRI